MKKNILVVAALVATLSTGALAYGQNKGNCDGQRMQQNKGMQQGMQRCMKQGSQQGMKQGMKQGSKQGMQKKGMKNCKQNRGMKQGMNKRSKGGMQLFSQLKLSDEQRFELSILKDEMRLEMKKSRGFQKQNRAMNFISEDGFDKAQFKKSANDRHAKKLELKANFMEKAFKILTKEQLAELKTLLAK